MSFKDKLIDYRNRYRTLRTKEAMGRYLTQLCETHDFERKYLIKLLNGQTISHPYTVAFQSQLLGISKGDKVLEIGTGSGFQAAILSVKLRHLDDDNHRRQAIANYYYDHISHPLITLPARLPDAHNVYHLFPVFSDHRDELQAYLNEKAVQTLIHYPIPPHQQECYSEWSHLSLPVTERIHRTELSIPISPVMSDGDAHAVVEALNSFQR